MTFTDTTLRLTNLTNKLNPVWIFKVGTGGTGALTGTGLAVVMADGSQPCNAYWWIAEAATMSDSTLKGTVLAGVAMTTTGGSLIGRVMAKAGVTMTGTDVFGCNNLPPNGGAGKTCHGHDKDKDKDKDKHHDKDRDHCKQGVGNGAENCDPGNSNHDDDSHSNDENGGTSGHPGRKGHDK